MKISTLTQLGIFTCMALLMGYIETLIPFFITIPGIRLGLPNFVILLVLYCYGKKEAFMINLARILLSGLLFGSMYTILYSLAGATLSFLIMVIAIKSDKCSVVGVSVLGGVFHNMGQLLMAMFVVKSVSIGYYYVPILILSGSITGFCLGILSKKMIPYFKKITT